MGSKKLQPHKPAPPLTTPYIGRVPQRLCGELTVKRPLGRKLLKALPQLKTKKQLCSQGAPTPRGDPGPTWGMGGGSVLLFKTPQGSSMTPSPRAG